MNRTVVGAICLAVGVVLLVLGVNSSESFASEISEFFNGTPTNEAVWFLLGGTVLLILGLVSLATRRGQRLAS